MIAHGKAKHEKPATTTPTAPTVPTGSESGGMSGGVVDALAGIWKWLRYWNCPKCGKRALKKTDTSYLEEGQRVQTGYDEYGKRQMMFSYGIRVESYECKECGHILVERSRYSGPA